MNKQIFTMWSVLMASAISACITSALVEASKFESLIGNSRENLARLKQYCEKDLPSDQECTLLYEFVPTKTKGEQ